MTVYTQDFETENTPDANYGWNTGDNLTRTLVLDSDNANHFYSLKGTWNRSLQFAATYTRYHLTFKWYAKLNSSTDKVQLKFITDHTSTTNKYQYRYSDISGKMYLSDGTVTDKNKSSYLELTNFTGTTSAPTSVSTDFYTVDVVSDGTNVRFTFTNPSGTSLSKTFSYSSDFAMGGVQVQNSNANGISYIDDIVLTAPVNNYTINYKLGDDIIKSEVGAANNGETINASAIPFTEGGQKYFKANDEVVTSWTKSGTEAETFNVALRLAKSATLHITKNVGGEETENEYTAIEADDGSLPWSYAWSLYEKNSSTGVYYRADNDDSFIESGTFTDGETISKTITYSTAETDVVFFTEVSATEDYDFVRTTDASYSGGTSERFYQGSRSYTIPADVGCYSLEIKVTGLDGTTNRGVTIKVAGTDLATYSTINVGTHTIPFVMSVANSALGISKGYNGTNFIDYIVIRRVANVPATIGSTGWTTFASSYPLDLTTLTASEGTATAYYASAANSSTVTMTSTTSTVPAGEGLMIKGTAGATVTIPVATSGTAISGNLLKGCTSSTALTTNSNYYVLVNNEGTPEFQCLDNNGATIPAGKAYLDLTGLSMARSLSIVFDDDETTSISEELRVNSEEFATAPVYDLQGRRVDGSRFMVHGSGLKPGLYIKNGKKVIVK